MEAKYRQLIERFSKDLQFVQDEYNEGKRDPPLARNLPPVSGKIAWARQLYHHISAPMQAFQSCSELMALPEMKAAVRRYNRLARVLVEYEMVFLKVWDRQISQAKASLSSSVLARHGDSKQLLVNLDPAVSQLLRDVQVLRGMGVEVPTQGLLLYSQKFAIQERYNALKVSIDFIGNRH